MGRLRLLVAEGNVRETRERVARLTGATPAEGYARVLAGLAPDAAVDIVHPADPGANLPGPAGLADYDGVAVTGSALNVHKGDPASLAQVEFARAVFEAGVPFFGSCWGLQIATVAAGGVVRTNPAGREVGFARKVRLTAAGLDHPMHAGRPPVYDAPAVHADEVGTIAPGTTVTATNALSEVQAAEIRHGNGVFWGAVPPGVHAPSTSSACSSATGRSSSPRADPERRGPRRDVRRPARPRRRAVADATSPGATASTPTSPTRSVATSTCSTGSSVRYARPPPPAGAADLRSGPRRPREVQQRKRPADVVERRSPDDPVAEVRIEAAPGGVRLVDVHRDAAAARPDVLHEGAADPLAVAAGIDEQRVDVGLGRADEADRTIPVDGHPEIDQRQIVVADDAGVEGDVLGGEEVVRRRHRPVPDLEQRVAIARDRAADRDLPRLRHAQ